MSNWWRFVRGLVVLLSVVGLAAASLAPELVTAAPPLSYVLLAFDTRTLLALVVALFAVSFAIYLFFLHEEDPAARVYGGRDVEALVPVYRDSAVMHRSVEGLADSPYEDLTVTIVCEPDDEASLDRAAELAETHPEVRYLVNDDRRGSKAGALNTAIERSDADVIGVFDADQDPHRELVPHAVAALAKADIASAKSVPRPGGFFESEAYYEFLALYFLPQQLAKLLLGLEFVGSQSVLLDASVFETVGLYDEDTLTEDMDFTHRCHQAGMSVRELNYYPCFEEPTHGLGDWWGQRVRWMTGHVEVGHGHLRDWRSGLDPAFLSSLLTLVGTFVAGVVLTMTVPKLVAAGLSHPWFVGGGLAALFGVLLATRAVDNRTAGTRGFGLAWLLLPVFFSLYGLVIVRVLLGYAAGRENDWYRVAKGA